MRVLQIGDIVGKPGRVITRKAVKLLKQSRNLDLVIANAENSAGGSGITPQIYNELIKADVDAITLSLARMSQDDLGLRTAATGIIIAATVNRSSAWTPTASGPARKSAC